MPNLIQINSFSNKFSQNLFPAKSTFTDLVNPVSFNTTGGSASFGTGDPWRLDYSFFFTNTLFTTVDLSFNLGDALTTEVAQTGNYLFQMAIRDDVSGPNSFLPFDFEVLIYKDAVHTDTFEGTFDVDSTTYNGKWAVFSQNIFINSLVEVDFSFKIKHNPLAPTSTQSCQIGMLKLELDNKFIGTRSAYSLPVSFFSESSDLHIAETQWNVSDVGAQVVANGDSLNLFTLIDNAINKDNVNSDSYDQLDIVTNAIKTVYRGNKIIHTIRVSFNIITGTDQFYQLQIRRAIDDSVVYRSQIQRNADETIQTVEMTTRTLSTTDPFVIDGFYIAFVNNSGASATIDDALSVLVISHYQKSQKQ